MKSTRKTIFIVAPFLLSGCATSGEKTGATAMGCDVSWITSSQLSPERSCELRALAKRCAASDQCQIQCEAKGGLPNVGGGCSHVCQGGGSGQTDEDIAKNGGAYATPESVACYNRPR